MEDLETLLAISNTILTWFAQVWLMPPSVHTISLPSALYLSEHVIPDKKNTSLIAKRQFA